VTGVVQHLVSHIEDHRLGDFQVLRIVTGPLEVEMFCIDGLFDLFPVDGVSPFVDLSEILGWTRTVEFLDGMTDDRLLAHCFAVEARSGFFSVTQSFKWPLVLLAGDAWHAPKPPRCLRGAR